MESDLLLLEQQAFHEPRGQHRPIHGVDQTAQKTKLSQNKHGCDVQRQYPDPGRSHAMTSARNDEDRLPPASISLLLVLARNGNQKAGERNIQPPGRPMNRDGPTSEQLGLLAPILSRVFNHLDYFSKR